MWLIGEMRSSSVPMQEEQRGEIKSIAFGPSSITDGFSHRPQSHDIGRSTRCRLCADQQGKDERFCAWCRRSNGDSGRRCSRQSEFFVSACIASSRHSSLLWLSKVAILIDDMCDTGETIKLATNALIEGGARSVYAVVSHGTSSLLCDLHDTQQNVCLHVHDIAQVSCQARV